MPLKFACPQCKTIISVDEKLAGRSGKCKCGAAIKIPVPRTAVAAPGAGSQQPKPLAAAASAGPISATEAPRPLNPGLASVFDELTEADYNRQSPLQNVYAPPKTTSTEAATLRRFEDGSATQSKKGQPGELNGTLIFIAVMNFLSALVLLGVAAVLLLAAAVIPPAAIESVPMLRAGLGVGAAVLLLLATIGICGGVGLLLKKKWGWFIIAFNFAFAIVDRIVGIIVVIANGEFRVTALVSSIFFTLAVISFGAFMYKEETRRIYRIRTLTLPIVAACTGAGLALAICGALFAMGAFSADVPV